MSTLHVETRGTGPRLVLLHGWGLHGGVWGPFVEALSTRFAVHLVDLPGHGHSRDVQANPTAEDYARVVLACCPQEAAWLGWSLGGLVALAAARLAPQTVRRLVLIGATPRFVQSPDWPHGMAPETLSEFGAGLEQDYRATLNRFLSLQLGSGDRERALLRALREVLFARGEPTVEALRAGLAILAQTDLRVTLTDIAVPALIVHGGRDRLVPVAAGEHLAAHLPAARCLRLDGEGHAPFLLQPETVANAVAEFVHG
jgi:pimeloyl-[acyl-carrier protein] methyl ester esterase